MDLNNRRTGKDATEPRALGLGGGMSGGTDGADLLSVFLKCFAQFAL